MLLVEGGEFHFQWSPKESAVICPPAVFPCCRCWGLVDHLWWKQNQQPLLWLILEKWRRKKPFFPNTFSSKSQTSLLRSKIGWAITAHEGIDKPLFMREERKTGSTLLLQVETQQRGLQMLIPPQWTVISSTPGAHSLEWKKQWAQLYLPLILLQQYHHQQNHHCNLLSVCILIYLPWLTCSI